MKKMLLFILCIVMGNSSLWADEGMWLLPWLQKINIKDMKSKGLKMSANDIYNLNGNSLKDAVVLFGGGCTGEIISAEGLLLTNHHCGYGTIQRLSSMENDYLENGFWALDRSEELPCPGMSVTFIRQIEDVTEWILPYVSEKMADSARLGAIADRIREIEQNALPEGSSCKVEVRDFFEGNQYLMFTTERYPDLRLVGAPPSSIGKFGGDTDNWMWPRHTGDFAMFRIYAGANGRPAEYSKENTPYQAPTHLMISLKGVRSGDFAMILGFPGSTERYATSYEIDQTYHTENPIRILIRGERQEAMMEDMLTNPKVRLQYANKYAGSSNYWKNSIGMNRAIEKLNILAKKRAQEAAFSEWATSSSGRSAKYGNALPTIETIISTWAPLARQAMYLSEGLVRGIELLNMATPWVNLLARDTNNQVVPLDSARMDQLRHSAQGLYKDYNPPTDRKVAKRLIRIIHDSLSTAQQPDYMLCIDSLFGGDSDAFVDALFDRSVFASLHTYETVLENPDYEALWNDPAISFSRSVQACMQDLSSVQRKNDVLLFRLARRHYLAGLMEMQPQRKFYPDANLTMRLSYGQVLPYRPADGVIYDYYTTLSGVLAKESSTNAYEFTVPEHLKELHSAGDFGPYAEAGDVRVNFLTNNDITGGNSGSPVLNARGELIGLAFDGNWEAMSGDIIFEPELQRTICVDIRYVLFLIDRYAGASYLLREMTLVSGKQP